MHLKPRVDPETLSHRQLKGGAFWQQIPAWKDDDEATFLSHLWQEKNAITTPDKLLGAVRELVSADFLKDVEAGFQKAPMAVRIRPMATRNQKNWGVSMRRLRSPVLSMIR